MLGRGRRRFAGDHFTDCFEVVPELIPFVLGSGLPFGKADSRGGDLVDRLNGRFGTVRTGPYLNTVTFPGL